MKFLIVFNTCGINPKNIPKWIRHITSLQNYNAEKYDCDFVLSNCQSSQRMIDVLVRRLSGKNIYINYILDTLPVFATFNHSVKQMEKTKNKTYDFVIYVDSGIHSSEPIDVIFETCKKYPDMGGIIVAADNDNGEGPRKITLQSDEDLVYFNHNQSLNLHVMAVNKKVAKAYGSHMPDNFCGCGSENTYWYIFYSLGLRYGLIPANKLTLKHVQRLDGRNIHYGSKHFYGDETTSQQFSSELVSSSIGWASICNSIRPSKPKLDSKDSLEDITRMIKKYYYFDHDYNKINHKFYQLDGYICEF